MCKVEFGIDTFSYYYKLTSKQKSKIIERLETKQGFRAQTNDYLSDTYAYSSDCFKDEGIRIWIKRISGSPWGLLIVVHPTLVLGLSDRSALYQPQKKGNYKKIIECVDKLLNPIGVPCSIGEMKLYRIDITSNLIFEDEAFIYEYLRILKKSCLLPHYKNDWFRKKEQKAKDCEAANKHSFKQYCKSAAFFSYDKTAQLEMIGAFPASLIGKRVLRLEAQLRRNGMKKWVGKDAMGGSNWGILKKLWKNSEKIIRWYIKRLQPVGEQCVRYEDAMDKLKNVKNRKTRERMLCLLRKTSDSETLTAALEKLGEKYSLNKGQQKTILKKFEKLQISPITLANSSVHEFLRPIQDLI